MPPRVTATTPPDDPQDIVPCFDCDADTRKVLQEHTFTYGTGPDSAELTVTLPVHVCPSCGFECLDHEAQTLQHEAVCAHLGVLPPNDVRGIRKKYGMSRAAFSRVTGLGEATLNRWENGILIQSAANDRYLRLLAEPDNLRRLQRLDAERTATAPSSETGDGRCRTGQAAARPAPVAAETGRFPLISESEHRPQQERFHLIPAAA